MAEDVPPANFIPTAARKSAIKKRRRIIDGQLSIVESECMFPGRLFQPFLHDGGEPV